MYILFSVKTKKIQRMYSAIGGSPILLVMCYGDVCDCLMMRTKAFLVINILDNVLFPRPYSTVFAH